MRRLITGAMLTGAVSYAVFEATLFSEGEAYGKLHGARVRVTSWRDASHPNIRYADELVSLRAELSLDDPHTYLSAGVGRRTRVDTGGPFSIHMRPGTWAPVLRADGEGIRIGLPPGLPASEATLQSGSGVRNRDVPTETFEHVGPPAGYEHSCGLVSLHPSPSRSGAPWQVDTSRSVLRVGARRGDFLRVHAYVHGFVVHGWLEGEMPTCTEHGIHLGTIGTGCGDGYGMGVVVTLPAGTPLYATRDASRPFGRLRRPMLGFEPLEHMPAHGCIDHVCDRVPPEPTGPARWIIDGEQWTITAWVRTPAEQLFRPDNASSGFGGCSTSPDEWPGR